MKLPGSLHLEGQIQSLIKSSEKELDGFVSAFLRVHHSPIQGDLAALAQETISRMSVLLHWEITGIMITQSTVQTTHHQGLDSILQVTVNSQIQMTVAIEEFVNFSFLFSMSQCRGTVFQPPTLLQLNRLQHTEHMDFC